MLRFAADENFNSLVVRGVLRRNPDIDIVRVQDVGPLGADDPSLIEWAAQEKRLLLTHDINTVTRYAYDRVRAGLPMPGVIEVRNDAPVGQTIEDILIVAECSSPDEYEGQVRYLPL